MHDTGRFAKALAEALVEAHRTGRSFRPEPMGALTLADAYAAQRGLMDAFGPVGAFKTARRDGDPIMAPIRKDRCHASGARVAVPERIGVELEVGFLVTGDLPAPQDPDFRARLLAAVRPVPVIELCASRLEGPLAADAMAKLADLQTNEGVVVGTPLPDWDGSDFGAVRARMMAGDSIICDGGVTVPGSSAIEALAGLVRIVGDHCGGLGQGHVVLTGSLHPLTWIAPGQEVSGVIDGLGPVSVTLA